MIPELLYLLVGLPCMACLQSLFAVLLPAKTWEIRRLQAYVMLLTAAGLSFVVFGCVSFWLKSSLWLIAAPFLVGYVLLLAGGWLGRWVEEANPKSH